MKKIMHCLGYAVTMANCLLALSILAGILMFGSVRMTFYEPNTTIICTEVVLASFGIAWFNWAFFKKVAIDD